MVKKKRKKGNQIQKRNCKKTATREAVRKENVKQNGRHLKIRQ